MRLPIRSVIAYRAPLSLGQTVSKVRSKSRSAGVLPRAPALSRSEGERVTHETQRIQRLIRSKRTVAFLLRGGESSRQSATVLPSVALQDSCKAPFEICKSLICRVPGGGLEPPLHCWKRILSPQRLPFRHPGLPRGKACPGPRGSSMRKRWPLGSAAPPCRRTDPDPPASGCAPPRSAPLLPPTSRPGTPSRKRFAESPGLCMLQCR